ECPDLVEPQIILRGKHTHNSTNGEGSDYDRKHGRIKPWPLSPTWCFHKDWTTRETASARSAVAPYLRFSGSRNMTTSRTKSRRCDSASAAETASLLMNIAWMTCCPKWRRPSRTERTRSARVHSDRLPDIPGEFAPCDAAVGPEARSSDKQ